MARTSPFIVYLSFDFSQVRGFSRLMRTRTNQRVVFESAAERLTKWLRRRFIHLSANEGGGEWAPLSPVTIKIKQWMVKHKGITAEPKWVLRRYMKLVNSFAYVIGNDGFNAGIITNQVYPITGIPLTRIAAAHQSGVGIGGRKLPVRKVIANPTSDILNRMVEDMQRGLNRVIREANREK